MAGNDIPIVCAEDCGNAPKKVVIRDFIAALARGDEEFLRGNVTDHVRRDIVGRQSIVGADAFLRHALEESGRPISEVRIHNIITHGNVGAADGMIVTDEGRTAFCEVFRFGSFAKHARIKEITSYIIPLPSEDA